MTTQIDVTELTSGSVVNQEWQGTGVFDTLIAAVNKNIELQYSKGRITGNDYSTVYLGAMQAVLGQSIEFLLRRDLTAAQIDDARKGIEVKDSQISNMEDDNLTAAKQREVLDKDIQVKEEQRKGLYAERVVKDKTAASLGLDNVVKQSEASRTDPTFVYSPRYNEV